MLTDPQARLLMLALVSLVGTTLAWGFVRAWRTGEIGVSWSANNNLDEIVRRDTDPRRYRRIMLFWALMLLLCAGLFVISWFGMP